MSNGSNTQAEKVKWVRHSWLKAIEGTLFLYSDGSIKNSWRRTIVEKAKALVICVDELNAKFSD